MTRTVDRLLDLEEVTLASFTGHDGQGKPVYADDVTFDAHVVEEDVWIQGPSEVREQTTLTVYVPGDVSTAPKFGDRLTARGLLYTVRERTAPKDFGSGSVDHYRLRCREG